MRDGDIISPKVDKGKPLKNQAIHFLECTKRASVRFQMVTNSNSNVHSNKGFNVRDSKMKVVVVDPRTDLLWETLIKRYNASVFHSPHWMNVLTQTYGFDLTAYIALNSLEVPIGGIAFCSIKDILGDRMVALPFSEHCDPLVDNEEMWDHLVARVTEENRPIFLRCLHNSIPLYDNRFAVAKKAKWHGLNIEVDLDTLWENLHSSRRWGIRKAYKHGVSIEITYDKETLKKFYQLHLEIRKCKYRLLTQPFKFFENIWEFFLESNQLYMLVAIYEKKIVASSLFLGWGDTLYYKFNASDPSYLIHCPNDLLIWEVIKLCKGNGYRQIDFGLSDYHQEGLIRFKRQFGGEEKEIRHLRYLTESMDDEISLEAKRVLGNLTGLFTDKSVPDQITAKAGEILYRFFT